MTAGCLSRAIAALLTAAFICAAPGRARAGEEKYRVASGESLSIIAGHFYGDEELYGLLALYNGKADPTRISTGELLSLPFSDTVTVRKGESLAVLSRRLWGDSDLYPILAELNGIRRPEAVPAGARLKVPVMFPYTLGRGENLAAIAERFYGSHERYSLIALASGIADPARVAAGSRLKVPLVLTRAAEAIATPSKALSPGPAARPAAPPAPSPSRASEPAIPPAVTPRAEKTDPAPPAPKEEALPEATPPAPPPIPAALSEAEAQYRAGNFGTARDLLLGSLDSLKGENRGTALRLLSLCQYAFGDRAAALRTLREAIQADPGFVPQPSVFNPDMMRIYQEARKSR